MSEEEKVVDLHPERKNKLPKGKLIAFLALALVVLCAVFCLLMPEQLNLDAVSRLFKYIGKRDPESYGTITYHTGERAAFASFADGLLIGNENGLALYDCSGSLLAESEGAFTDAAVLSGDKLALCYASGSEVFVGMNRKGERVLDRKAAGEILDAAVSNDGCVCYLTAESSYKSVATVLGSKLTEAYKWYSSTQYLNACAISEGGKYLAVAGLGQEDSSFNSSLTLLKTDEQEPVASWNLGGQLIYELAFIKSDLLCAVGESSLSLLNTNGELLKEISYEGMYLERVGFSREGFVSLLLNENPSGNKSWLVTLSAQGEELSRVLLGSEVRSLSVCGRYIAVLTPGKLTLYNRTGKVYAETADVGNTARVLARNDGTVLLCGSEETVLFIP